MWGLRKDPPPQRNRMTLLELSLEEGFHLPRSTTALEPPAPLGALRNSPQGLSSKPLKGLGGSALPVGLQQKSAAVGLALHPLSPKVELRDDRSSFLLLSTWRSQCLGVSDQFHLRNQDRVSCPHKAHRETGEVKETCDEIALVPLQWHVRGSSSGMCEEVVICLEEVVIMMGKNVQGEV